MSDEKPKRMSDEEWDRLDDLDIVDLTPTKWERARTEIERARASEKQFEVDREWALSLLRDLFHGWPLQTILAQPDEFASPDGLIRGATVRLNVLKDLVAALSEVES